MTSTGRARGVPGPPRRRLAAAVATALALGPLASCVRIEMFTLDNRTASGLHAYHASLLRGFVAPGHPTEVTLESFERCTVDEYLVTTEDGSRVTVLPPGICPGDVVVVEAHDLLPATATATVMNRSPEDVDVYVDGARVGSVPANLSLRVDLPEGVCATVHVVSFGRQMWAEAADLCPGAEAAFTLGGLRAGAEAFVQARVREPFPVRLSGPTYAFELEAGRKYQDLVPLWREEGCVGITDMTSSPGPDWDARMTQRWAGRLCNGDSWVLVP